MSADIEANNDTVLAAVKSWNRMREKGRRFMMLYRDANDSELVVDVLEFLGAFTRPSQDGKLSGWLLVLTPEIESDDAGARHLAWTAEQRIPLECVIHKKLLPKGWPGFMGFQVSSSDPINRGMQDRYEAEVRQGLALAEEMGFSSKTEGLSFKAWPEWQRRAVALGVLGVCFLLIASCLFRP